MTARRAKQQIGRVIRAELAHYSRHAQARESIPVLEKAAAACRSAGMNVELARDFKFVIYANLEITSPICFTLDGECLFIVEPRSTLPRVLLSLGASS